MSLVAGTMLFGETASGEKKTKNQGWKIIVILLLFAYFIGISSFAARQL
jgi:hypothetical protein